jgi:hypothetical protein
MRARKKSRDYHNEREETCEKSTQKVKQAFSHTPNGIDHTQQLAN